jgi:hypothetical protein
VTRTKGQIKNMICDILTNYKYQNFKDKDGKDLYFSTGKVADLILDISEIKEALDFLESEREYREEEKKGNCTDASVCGF